MADLLLGSKAKARDAGKGIEKGTEKGTEKGKAKIPQKVAAKYRDEAGNTWSGRGLQPRWLKAAIGAGKKIEDFAV